ncbi:MAG: hypothetical protein HQ523_14540 [Lentisphaerae bacterium]|nr:hypothetical protein [Lentisphaerota bacterium]
MKVLWILWIALGCLVAGCSDDGGGDSGCITLGHETVAQQARQIDTPLRQILIEARIVGVRKDHLIYLGLDFNQTAEIGTDGGGTKGSSSGDGRNLVVNTSVLGGPNNVQYLVAGSQSAGENVGYITPGFSDPFGLVRAFMQLPFESCVDFNESDVVEPTGLSGLPGERNLGAADMGYGGSTLYFTQVSDAAINAALNTLQYSDGNTIISAPSVSLYDGQRTALMVNEFQPSLDQLEKPFADQVSRVTSDTSDISTGIVLDVRPVITAENQISLELRPGTLGVSFSRRIPLNVGDQPSDLVVPVVQPSRNMTTIIVTDGETVVLGGLKRSGSETVEAGVPFLGDVPILGALFRQTGLDDERQNLLIFVTARIIDPAGS